MNIRQYHRTDYLQRARQCLFAVLFAVLFVMGCVSFSRPGLAQDAPLKIWEFTPYEVEVWCALDPDLNVSETAQSQFIKSLGDDLDRAFQSAWRTRVMPVDSEQRSRIARHLDVIKLDDFTREELVLVVNRDPANASVRTLDTAIEKMSEFAIAAEHKAKFDRSLSKAGLDAESPISKMAEKLKVIDGGIAAITAGLESKTITTALVPKSIVDKSFEKLARTLPLLLPWQTESILRERDKIFLMHVSKTPVGYKVATREIDCSLRYFGPTIHQSTPSWSYLSRAASSAVTTAFAPMARVENAQAKSAELRLKAGGLIITDDNPAIVHPGDLMHPIVRREDRNGIPDLIEPLPWTYAAITQTDGVKMNSNVYAYSGGPGLQGKNNRRTQRLLLRVRPVYAETDIMVTVRSTGRPQAGCAVYDRAIEDEKFTLLGQTDWRGRFTVRPPAQNASILPEAIRAAKEAAEKKAKEAADLAAANAEAAKAKPNEEEGEENDASASVAKKEPEPAAPPATPQVAVETVDVSGKAIPLRQPLVQLYVKSGDVTLARLPVVPGISPLEKADLSDDSRRLEAEAFMRGFQGEILDLIGLRALLSTRINRLVAQNKMKEAEKALNELRALKDYSGMVEGLDKLQRKVLDESNGPISLGAKSRIDRLFQSTREMMQKFLQNDLVRDAETTFSKGQGGQDAAAAAGQDASTAQAAGDVQCSLAEFTFTLPSRFKFVDPATLPKMPSNIEMKNWRTDANPGAAFLATAVKDSSNVGLDAAGIAKNLNNYIAGFTDSLGIKVTNRTTPQAVNINGLQVTQFEWSGSLGDQPAFGLVYGVFRDDRMIVFAHIGFVGDQTSTHQEIRKYLASLKAN